MARRIPLDFLPTGGINTTYNSATLGGRFLSKCVNADSYKIHGGLGMLPGSTCVSEKAPAAWAWIYYFEFFDVDGIFKRQLLGVAGDTFYVMAVGASTALLPVASGFTSSPMYGVTRDNRAYFTGGDNDPMKWDGHALSSWGVTAPGSEDQLLYAVDSAGSWTPNGVNTVSAGSVEIGNSPGSVRLQKDDTTNATVTMTSTDSYTLDASKLELTVYCYIPRGVFDILSDKPALRIDMQYTVTGQDTFWEIDIGNRLAPGWNQLRLSQLGFLANPLNTYAAQTAGVPIGPGGTVDTTILTFTTNSTAATTTDLGLPISVTWDDFTQQSTGPAVATLVGPLGPAPGKDYSYRIAYLNSAGQLSNAGPASDDIAVSAGETVSVSLPVSPAPDVIARYIYRDLDGDDIWRFLASVPNNVDTSVNDAVAANPEGDLAALPASSFVDYSTPPEMESVVFWGDRIYGIQSNDRYRLVSSDIANPEGFPLAILFSRRNFPSELTRLELVPDGLLIFTTDRTYFLSDPNENPEMLGPKVGCVGPRASASSHQFALAWHDDGPYVHDGKSNFYYGIFLKDQLIELEADTISEMFMENARGRFQVVQFIKDSSGDYTKVLSWAYGTGGPGEVTALGTGISALDPRRGTWHEMELPASINPQCAATVESGIDRPELWVGAEDGYIYRLLDPESFKHGCSSPAEPVVCDIETLPQAVNAEDTNVTGEPRKLNLAGVGEGSEALEWTVTVSTLTGPDGKVIESRSFLVECPVGDFDLVAPVPEGLTRGSWVRVRLQASSFFARTTFRKIRVSVTPGRYRGVRAS